MVTAGKKIVTAKSVKATAIVPAKVAQTPTTVAKVAPKVAARPVLKVAATPTIKPTAKPKAEKPVKMKKSKLVRDSFTIPKTEYSVLDDLKQRAGKLACPVKKSKLLRAGVKALASMTDAAFLAAVKAVPAIKTGRRSKN